MKFPEPPERARPSTRLWRRLGTTAVIAGLVSCNLHPAWAQPKPLPEEWWFDAWEISSKVWPITKGDGVTVAVIDNGVESRLPDLHGVVLPGVGYDGASRKDGRADDDTQKGGHGTGMAALIAGQGLGSGMMGVAPNSKILPISAATDDYERTIPYAVDHGAKVISISESTVSAYCPAGVQKAVTYAVQHDVVVVASAGNSALDGSANTPANCHGVVAVGAVDANLKVWSETSPGKNVAVAAPGVDVGSIGKNGTFTSGLSGTSQAAALAAGVVALMRSHFPQAPAREIVQRLLATARDVGPAGWDERTGYGAIIPYQAIVAQVSKSFPNPVYDSSRTEARGGHAAELAPAPGKRDRNVGEDERHSKLKKPLVVASCIAILAIGGLLIAYSIKRRHLK